MKNLILLFIIFLLLGGLVFAILSIFGGTDAIPFLGSPAETEQSDGFDEGGYSGTTDDATGSATDDSSDTTDDADDADTTDDTEEEIDENGNSVYDYTDSTSSDDTTTAGDPDSGLPNTAIVNDTVDMVIAGIVLMIFATILFKTNAIGKVFFPASEDGGNFNFFNIDDRNPRERKKMVKQLKRLNKNIRE